MSEPFIAEIRMVAFNFAPRGWALCNGQLLPIAQNQALFSILGTTYGGNGQTTFALPNLRGRSPAHVGSDIQLGRMGGEESHALNNAEMPAHTHVAAGDAAEASAPSPAGNVWAASSNNPFSSAGPNTTMNSGSVSTAGGSQPHPNQQPYLAVNFVIALVGIYPSRN